MLGNHSWCIAGAQDEAKGTTVDEISLRDLYATDAHTRALTSPPLLSQIEGSLSGDDRGAVTPFSTERHRSHMFPKVPT